MQKKWYSKLSIGRSKVNRALDRLQFKPSLTAAFEQEITGIHGVSSWLLSLLGVNGVSVGDPSVEYQELNLPLSNQMRARNRNLRLAYYLDSSTEQEVPYSKEGPLETIDSLQTVFNAGYQTGHDVIDVRVPEHRMIIWVPRIYPRTRGDNSACRADPSVMILEDPGPFNIEPNNVAGLPIYTPSEEARVMAIAQEIDSRLEKST
jgi:hypothetical protein